jgi:hypothetical protein
MMKDLTPLFIVFVTPLFIVFAAGLKGGKIKTRAVMTGRLWLLFGLHITGAIKISPTLDQYV